MFFTICSDLFFGERPSWINSRASFLVVNAPSITLEYTASSKTASRNASSYSGRSNTISRRAREMTSSACEEMLSVSTHQNGLPSMERSGRLSDLSFLAFCSSGHTFEMGRETGKRWIISFLGRYFSKYVSMISCMISLQRHSNYLLFYFYYSSKARLYSIARRRFFICFFS